MPKNFAVQLKIISAVKAAQGDDKTAETQLFNCAKQLASSVNQVLEAAEAAALATK